MPSKFPAQRFQDILDNIGRIERYTKDMNKDRFMADERTYDAVERCISRISEAAVKLGNIADRLAPDQPWPDIRGIGNEIRHAYDGIDEEIIWLTVMDKLPLLKQDCLKALWELEQDE